MTESKKGILLLADVVEYTSQTEELGSNKTERFNQHLEKKIRKLTGKHKGKFIRRIGDAILIYFADESRFLDFVIQLRELSRTGSLNFADFIASLRMVAHFGNFSFTLLDGDISDFIGPEGIKLFRIEKYAEENDVLITEFLFLILKNELISKNIKEIKLDRVELKGFDSEMLLYKLNFPETEDIENSNLLNKKMSDLGNSSKEIKVFGDLYPAMSMEENFINLDIKTESDKKEEIHMYEDAASNVDTMIGIDANREKFINKAPPDGSEPMNVKVLYETQLRGIIMGLPGSGKTTILKYFAYRELKSKYNRKIDESKDQRCVLFIECRDIMSYKEWYRKRYPNEENAQIDYNLDKILNYLTTCFLFKKDYEEKNNEALKKTEKLVRQAFHGNRLTVLIDALDEAPKREVKDDIINNVSKALFLDAKNEKRKNNRIYITTRYSEKEDYFSGENAEILRPLFEVRTLDMEQLREMAAFFYKGQMELYRQFDQVVWREEIASKVGGTPLTALLVIVYFEIFRKFDTRYYMYNIIVVFILMRVWKQIKEQHFDIDFKDFFKKAKSKEILKKEGHAEIIYDALTLLAFEFMNIGRMMYEAEIVGVFKIFAEEVEGIDEPKKEAEQWLRRMKEDHLFVSAGPNAYVFIHSTVMEYLAARYIVEKLKNPNYLQKVLKNKKQNELAQKKQLSFFNTEVLPIAVGSGIKHGASILRDIKIFIQKAPSNKLKVFFYNLALRSLAEFESIIDRQYREKRLRFLHQDMEKQIAENFDAVDWIYQYLGNIVLNGKKDQLITFMEAFKNISKLSRPFFLEKYLDYDAFLDGDAEYVYLREKLLYNVINQECLDPWFSQNREAKEKELLQNENLLTMDSNDYHPEDKNFDYYKKNTRDMLKGFLGSPNLKHGGPINCVVFMPDGKSFISGSVDKTIKIWDFDTGKEICVIKGHKSEINSISVSADGRQIVSGSNDHLVKLWKSENGALINEFRGHKGPIISVAFTGDAKYILSASRDKTIKLWDVTKKRLMNTFTGHKGAVYSIDFNVDGKQIVSGSQDQTIKLWNVTTIEEICTIKGHNSPVYCVRFSKDGKYIISGSSNGIIKLWDTATGKELRSIKGHNNAIRCLDFSSCGKYIISGSIDSSIKLWDRLSGEEIRTYTGHNHSVEGIYFNLDNKKIISGSFDHTIKIWDRISGKETHTFKGHRGLINSIGVSGSGKDLISGSDDKTLKLWDITSGKELHTFKGHKSPVFSVGFSRDGKIISGSYDRTIKLWDIETKKEIRTIKEDKGKIRSIAFNSSGRYIAAGLEEDIIRLWDMSTGIKIHTFQSHKGAILSIDISEDGQLMISGSTDDTIKLWDLDKRTEIRTFNGHKGSIHSVSFCRDGKRFVSGSADNNIKLWQISGDKEIFTFIGHTGPIYSLITCKNGKHFISSSNDYTVKLWEIEGGRCIQSIKLSWNPCHIQELPGKPGMFATANANGTITFLDFREMI